VTLEFREVRGDARNALETGVDLLVTHEPTVIDYAEASAGFLAIPGPWTRAYVLLAPWGPQSPATLSRPDSDVPAVTPSVRVTLPPESARAALARDAVRAVARPTAVPAYDDVCRAGISGAAPRPSAARSVRVVFPAGDDVARGLGERLVALVGEIRLPENAWVADALPATGRPPAPLTATGLSGPAFDEALRSGSEAAYVVPVEVGARPGPCEAVATAVGLAPWLQAPPRNGQGSALFPLIETRSVFVARRGVHGLVVDGAGVLRFEGTRWEALEPAP
jgi:hypothetical protein